MQNLLKKELNETKSFKTSNTTIINKKIDKLNPIIDNDLKIINKIDESISNTTRKKYINLYSNTLKQDKTILISIKNEINLLKDVNNQEITMNEALSKIAEI